jgi:hypothetical protein
MKMTEELKVNHAIIKDWLRRGEIQALAAKHKISTSSAYKALNGERKNFEFVKACYELAIERKNTFKTLNDKLHTI